MNSNDFTASYGKYFAAANGFSGFKSYFNEIFNPLEYSAVFILKGGPGTGKNSLMKKLLNAFSSLVDSTESIYCSSDISSLDGLILRKGEKSIAVLDGTAPHATDPSYPGAIEEIVNLGELWSTEMLLGSRTEIVSLNKAKASSYRSAYNYLSLCGHVTKSADSLISEAYTKDDREAISSLIYGAKRDTSGHAIRLISAFGKDGFVRLDLSSDRAEIKHVVGVYGSEYIFMKNLKNTLDSQGIGYLLFPAPLDSNKIDGIYVSSLNRLILTESSCTLARDTVVDTSKFIDSKALKSNRERLEFLWHEREAMLWGSVDEFKKASDEHFKIEKIYTAAMDFEALDEKFKTLVTRIAKILGIDL